MNTINSSKSKREKVNYTPISNIMYIFEMQWKHHKLFLTFIIILIPLSLAISYFTIYLPTLVISLITSKETSSNIITSLVVFGILIISVNICKHLIDSRIFISATEFNNSIKFLTIKKSLNTDYENVESSKFRLLSKRVNDLFNMTGSDSPFTRLSKGAGELITNIIGYFLFGTIISFASPYIVVLLTVSALVNFFIIRSIQRYQYRHRNEITLYNSKLWYIANSSGDFNSAKDTRIYGMNEWFMNMFTSITKDKMRWSKKFALRYYISNIIDAGIILIRDGLAYAILIAMVINNEIDVNEFTFCFGAVGSFAGRVSDIINKFIEINAISFSVSDLRDYLNYRDKNKRDKGFKSQTKGSHCTVELKNVSYRYSDDENDTLKNISIKINHGEKIAIIGLNGAGKTTLIKNICGLYTPTNGCIRINDINMDEYNIYDYYSMFSVVFQDFHFLPISIADFISGKVSGNVDREKVNECIRLSGLESKINQMKNGIDSMLNKQLNRDGIELSGGEKQKLFLARALYKNASILILDEPTSALDPIAESALYKRYHELTKDKTSIYISHRLASTRFCDRILLMESGKIIEDGTHDELIKLNKKYARLFNIQKHYYNIT